MKLMSVNTCERLLALKRGGGDSQGKVDGDTAAKQG